LKALPGTASYKDLLEVPENKIAELIDGELYVWSRPAARDANAASVLAMFIGPAYHLGINGPGDWWIHSQPEVHLGEHVLVPDRAGWRRERMPTL
jgi:hypothetical protein